MTQLLAMLMYKMIIEATSKGIPVTGFNAGLTPGSDRIKLTITTSDKCASHEVSHDAFTALLPHLWSEKADLEVANLYSELDAIPGGM